MYIGGRLKSLNVLNQKFPPVKYCFNQSWIEIALTINERMYSFISSDSYVYLSCNQRVQNSLARKTHSKNPVQKALKNDFVL